MDGIKPQDKRELENMMGVENFPESCLPLWTKWMKRYHRCKPGTMSIPLEAKLAFVHACEEAGLLEFVQIDQARKLAHAEIERLHYNALVMISPDQKNHKPKFARFRGTEGNRVLCQLASKDKNGNEILEKEQKSVEYEKIHYAIEI